MGGYQNSVGPADRRGPLPSLAQAYQGNQELDFKSLCDTNLGCEDIEHLNAQFKNIANLLKDGMDVLFPSDDNNENRGLHTNLGLGTANRSNRDPLISSIQKCIEALKERSDKFNGKLLFGELNLKKAQKGIFQVWAADKSNMNNPTGGSGQAAVATSINQANLGNFLIPINTMGWSFSPSVQHSYSLVQSSSPVLKDSYQNEILAHFKNIVTSNQNGRVKLFQDKAIELKLTRDQFKDVIKKLRSDQNLIQLNDGFVDTLKAFTKMFSPQTGSDDYKEANEKFLEELDKNSEIFSEFKTIILQNFKGRLKLFQEKAIELKLTRDHFTKVIQQIKSDPDLEQKLDLGLITTIQAFDVMLSVKTLSGDHKEANEKFLNELDNNSQVSLHNKG